MQEKLVWTLPFWEYRVVFWIHWYQHQNQDRKISEAIENMEGKKSRYWETLKKELICKWGCATPLRRYGKNYIPNLILKYTEQGGIQTEEDYRNFISNLEEILAYLKKMGQKNVNVDSHCGM
ncbi:uncharacterized protein VP01_1800g11 [Puccinia sorghi]|uniref:Uncharacterized protein n=1 Tax=Puccinia sorghi TaxID=27349 RepID=A0A0L6VEW0_9BASI|nr:uncharacterized protein VP01_1800g11 [Puccinia sorghi]